MQLTQFSEKNNKELINWIDSKDLNTLWSGHSFLFPLTEVQLKTHYTNPCVFPFLFIINGKSVGYVELYKISEIEYRICRVFIAPNYRGHDYAAKMLSLLLNKAKQEFNCNFITLAVYSHNKPAIKCYKKLGFIPYKIDKNSIRNGNHSWDLIRMQKVMK